MDTITYSLSNNEDNSDLYYKEISLFSDIVLNKLRSVANLIIYDFIKFIKENNIEECRTREEYMIEFLSYLSRLRRENSFVKYGLDKSRGVLSTIFLSGDKQTNILEELSLKDLSNLLGWMEASLQF